MSLSSTTTEKLKKATGKRQIYFNTMGGLFFILALLKDGSTQRLKEAEEYTSLMSRQSDHWLRFIYDRLKTVLQVHQGDITQKQFVLSAHISSVEEENSLQTLFCSLCLYWMDAEGAKKRLPNLLEPLYRRSLASGYHWLAMETAELLSQLKPNSKYQKEAEALREDSGIHSIVDLIRPQEAWEMCLNALANLQKQPQTSLKSESELRLAWFITFYPSRCVLQPKEQKVNAKGEWSKGRPIALKRLSIRQLKVHLIPYLARCPLAWIKKLAFDLLGYILEPALVLPSGIQQFLRQLPDGLMSQTIHAVFS